ncbi:MAG: hypothetical protein MI723_06920 [Caulobacterales bacterium]|nr:hypothetical protein [Caulobacterales bacterium]
MGGGAGVAFGDRSADDEAFDVASDNSLAWQVGGGVMYKLNEKTSVGVGYRYFHAPGLFDRAETDEDITGALEADYADSAVTAEIGLTF